MERKEKETETSTLSVCYALGAMFYWILRRTQKKRMLYHSHSHFFFFLDKKTSSEKCTQLLCIILIQSPGLFSYASGPLHVWHPPTCGRLPLSPHSGLPWLARLGIEGHPIALVPYTILCFFRGLLTIHTLSCIVSLDFSDNSWRAVTLSAHRGSSST